MRGGEGLGRGESGEGRVLIASCGGLGRGENGDEDKDDAARHQTALPLVPAQVTQYALSHRYRNFILELVEFVELEARVPKLPIVVHVDSWTVDSWTSN